MVPSSKTFFSKEGTMKIALDLDIRFKEGTLLLKSGSSRTLIFPEDHVVQKKIQIFTLAELSDLTIEQICKLFNYKTRKSYYDIRRFVLENNIEALMPRKAGPKTVPKRLSEMEAIPFEGFKYRYKKQPVAKLVTELDGFTGKMKMFVKRNCDGTFFALITNKKYFRASRAMKIYRKRWRLENFFNENVFLGLDRLPSL
jgi:hypothetical protein